MITTIDIKREQLEHGFYSTGGGSEVIFIIGSCRAVPYINYLDHWNKKNGSRFYICFVDPFNWNWDKDDNRVDYAKALLKCEENDTLKTILENTDILIHEYYANAGMFNCTKGSDNNIYHFATNLKQDICLPNFNDIFILASDIVKFDSEIKKEAVQDFNVLGKLSKQTIDKIDIVRNNNLQKFYEICSKTSFPEFAGIFQAGYKRYRFFWTFNHIAKEFTLDIFCKIAKQLEIFMTADFFEDISSHDMYANNYTHLSEYDEGYLWNEPIKPLRESL